MKRQRSGTLWRKNMLVLKMVFLVWRALLTRAMPNVILPVEEFVSNQMTNYTPKCLGCRDGITETKQHTWSRRVSLIKICFLWLGYFLFSVCFITALKQECVTVFMNYFIKFCVFHHILVIFGQCIQWIKKTRMLLYITSTLNPLYLLILIPKNWSVLVLQQHNMFVLFFLELSPKVGSLDWGKLRMCVEAFLVGWAYFGRSRQIR